MATVKKLKVLTPQTIDGKTLAYDEDKKVIYSSSIVELAAKKDFEALNAKLPSHLHHILQEIEVDVNVKKVLGKNVDVPQTNEDPSLKDKIIAKDEEINTLKQKLADLNKKPNAAFVISKIDEATTQEEVNELIEGDDRATVIAAANKKIETLKAK